MCEWGGVSDNERKGEQQQQQLNELFTLLPTPLIAELKLSQNE
ncbi:unnamed protein product [Strongylus vulgaris]|uniref:Uncharacterized protein n=1 Tax=Strongylus vulgaris TaxID=40348 RepID=A0A3P7HZ76_STRVU|nr:unnamed protein product [Strongylus vulgaris]